jgi:hypothetical protein
MNKNFFVINGKDLPIALLILYGLAISVCFLLFKQHDLSHTYTSSYAYLRGHFSDFYEYNRTIVGGNDYLPIIYLIFAIWNIPLMVLGILSPPVAGGAAWEFSSPVEMIWSKLLLAFFFVGCVWFIAKIAALLGTRSNPSGFRPEWIFATSPIALFAVFTFSQYDVIGVFFTLAGLYCYFQKHFFKFALFFSFAISFKYFAAFIFLPLVLLIEKRFLYLLGYGLLGIAITSLQIALYWHSDVFQASFFNLASNKTGEALQKGKALVIFLLYAGLCLWMHRSNPPLDPRTSAWPQRALFASALAYALLFSLVRWHPQWLIILMPFFALLLLYLQRPGVFLSFEALAFIAYIWICVNVWPKNVDVTMIQNGVFQSYLPSLKHFGAELLSGKWAGLARTIFYIYLFSPLLFWLAQSRTRVYDYFNEKRLANPLLLPENAPPPNGTHLVAPRALSTTLIYLLRILIGGYFFLGVVLWSIVKS